MSKSEYEIEQLRHMLFDKATALIAADLASPNPGRYLQVTEKTRHLPEDLQLMELDTDLAAREAAQLYLACTEEAEQLTVIMDEREEAIAEAVEAFEEGELEDDGLSEYARTQKLMQAQSKLAQVGKQAQSAP